MCLIQKHRHSCRICPLPSGTKNGSFTTAYLKRFLKDREDILVRPKNNQFGSIIFHYLVSQLYLSGLLQNVNYVTVYPGHKAKNDDTVLLQFSDILRSFLKRGSYAPDLLIRHTDATEAKKQTDRNILDQLNTLLVNPDYSKRIKGKKLLVLDDFTTSGNSLETANRMLLEGGANRVIGLAIVKYRTNQNVSIIGKNWNPFEPENFSAKDVSTLTIRGTIHREADSYFYNNIWLIYAVGKE